MNRRGKSTTASLWRVHRYKEACARTTRQLAMEPAVGEFGLQTGIGLDSCEASLPMEQFEESRRLARRLRPDTGGSERWRRYPVIS